MNQTLHLMFENDNGNINYVINQILKIIIFDSFASIGLENKNEAKKHQNICKTKRRDAIIANRWN